MPFVVVFLALVGIGWFLWITPRWRVPGLVMLGLLGAGFAVYMMVTDPVPQVERGRITAEQVVLSDVVFDLGRRTSSLSGRVQNLSETYQLAGLSFVVTLYDCPEPDSDLSDCPAIGQDDGRATLIVPPGQVRSFDAVFLFPGLPDRTGTLRHDYRITDIRGILPAHR